MGFSERHEQASARPIPGPPPASFGPSSPSPARDYCGQAAYGLPTAQHADATDVIVSVIGDVIGHEATTTGQRRCRAYEV